MDNQLVSKFRFIDYKIDFIQYVINPNFKYENVIDLDYELNVDIGINKDRPEGKVSLHVIIFKNAMENNYPFSLDVAITGFFDADDEMPLNEFDEFCQINGTAALFPFLRSIVADITRTANVETLILPLTNIHNLIEKYKKNDDK